MLNILIFGGPGSGKGTQSDLIIEKYGLQHISTGEILRQEITAETELGKIADSYISKGELAPDYIVIDIMEELIKNNLHKEGLIFDGFPRTIAQGIALDNKLEKNGAEVSLVLCLKVDEEVLTERLLNRGKYSGRSDDNLMTIEARLKVYHEHTEPLINFYKEQGKLVCINGNNDVESIFKSIQKVIDKHLEKEYVK